jgi:hypothetical protein
MHKIDEIHGNNLTNTFFMLTFLECFDAFEEKNHQKLI